MRGMTQLSLSALLLLALASPGLAQSPAAGGGLLLDAGSGSQPAPMLASDVHVEIAGVVAHARVTQLFRNPTDQPLQAVYAFPLPAGAAVDGLSLAIGNRAVHGRIVERSAAEGTGEKALSEGRGSAVLAREGVDLFTVAVGAIAPGEEVAVVLDLQQVVAVENGRFTLRFPLVARPSPGAAPGTSEEVTRGLAGPRATRATRANTARNAQTDAPSLVNPFDLHVDLYPGIRLGRIDSPSHTIRVAEKAGPLYTVDLERAASADRDFVLSWEPVAGIAAQAALYAEEREGERYVLLVVMPPAGAPLSDVAVRWDDESAETWPQSLTAKPGEALVVATRLTPSASLAVLSGRRGKEPWEVVLPLTSAAPSQGIDKLWARLKVNALSAGPQDERAAAAAREAITELGLRYGLVTEYTSLVAEDTVVASATGAPLRAWVPLAEPAVAEVVNEATLKPSRPPAVLAAKAVAVAKPIPAPASVRARPDATRAQLRRRLHHGPRHHRRLHRKRRHHRARAKAKVVLPVAPGGDALTPRARLGAQSQRR